ncbi:MAG: hypothetical protein AMXMBFR82_50290 [Candidatus Hydrogenedentota bacterium]
MDVRADNSKQSLRRTFAVLLIGITLGIAMRWVFPAADPPLSRQTGAYWWDEVWSIGARNGALFGSWQQDEYNPWTVCPLHTALVQGFLELFGVNAFGLRFLAMAGGTLSIALAFLQTRLLGLSVRAGLMGAFFVATSWTLVGFSRSMTLEPSIMLFVHLSSTLVLLGERSGRFRLAWYALAGAAGGCAVLCKTSAAVYVLTMSLFLVAGPLANDGLHRWRWRITRTLVFGVASLAAFGAGFLLWTREWRDTFVSIAFDTMLYGRAGTTLGMRVYKAVTWADSQAFLSAPALIVAVLLVLPLLVRVARTRLETVSSIQRFGFWLALINVILGIAVLINVDVPARRVVYLNLFLALLAAIAVDWLRQREDDLANPAPSRVNALWTVCAFVVAGLVLSGWLVSPHGGMLSFVNPALASRILFTMQLKIADKAAWLLLGVAIAAALYRWREALWQRAGQIVSYATVAQLALFLIASGLWIARLSYTVQDASMRIEEITGRESYVLGGDASALGFNNTTHPLFWTPKAIPYTNVDVDLITQKYDPQYLAISELMWNEINAGLYGGQPYAQTFQHEVARLPLYEIHESKDLHGDILILKRSPR